MTYKDVGVWIKVEVKKKSFKDIKSYEKILRTHVKKGELKRLKTVNLSADDYIGTDRTWESTGNNLTGDMVIGSLSVKGNVQAGSRQNLLIRN
jgi:hypothetical protein